eukprot:133151-Rhodomonas_salina.1
MRAVAGGAAGATLRELLASRAGDPGPQPAVPMGVQKEKGQMEEATERERGSGGSEGRRAGEEEEGGKEPVEQVVGGGAGRRR